MLKIKFAINNCATALASQGKNNRAYPIGEYGEIPVWVQSAH
jgi:hypothetical protein